MKTIRIGTRGSDLALVQATATERALAGAFPEALLKREVIKTTGDRRTDVALSEVAKVEGIIDKGVFTKELEVALAAKGGRGRRHVKEDQTPQYVHHPIPDQHRSL